MRLGPVCALLWRIQTWCSWKKVTLKVQHIPGWLNVVADKLSRLGQIIQREWSLFQQHITSGCVTSFRLPSLGSRCTQSTLGGPGPIFIPTSSHFRQSGGKTEGSLPKGLEGGSDLLKTANKSPLPSKEGLSKD